MGSMYCVSSQASIGVFLSLVYIREFSFCHRGKLSFYPSDDEGATLVVVVDDNRYSKGCVTHWKKALTLIFQSRASSSLSLCGGGCVIIAASCFMA
mmetsp:Transcript_2331/g.2619  ORF Transcript_2331/g.2619 Transcript_2331/m.2619 type:complete len:96 (+) Transcript_2331:137-424(+)